MTDPCADYRVDTLMLLMGENPLPNFVAARLLADTSARLLLVHSHGTHKQCERLQKVLQSKGYSFENDNTVEVEESNPTNIFNEVQKRLANITGRVGLHYTGGTKTMAVHAYRALEQTNVAEKCYSYLDARSLSMVFSHRATPVPVGFHERANVSLQELLDLHGMSETARDMQGSDSLIWPNTTQALANVHKNEDQYTAWRAWCNTTLRDPNKDYDHRKKTDLKKQSTEQIPSPAILQALQEDTGLALPIRMDDLMKINKDAAGWLDGKWLEEYVFRQIEPMSKDMNIYDIQMTINPKIGISDFEFDVGFMRGYQFFGLSCTTEDGSKGKFAILKSKLLEASVRAEQLGGGEAQFALVCCANAERVKKLHVQMNELPGAKRMKVFGRDDLGKLQEKIRTWIKEASRT